MSSTPKAIIVIVVSTLAALSVIGLCALAGTLYFKNYADPAVLSAFISVTSTSIGALGGLLSNTRQPSSTNGATATATTSTTTTTTTPHPVVTPNDPVPVQVVNAPEDPVPTEETKK